MVNPLLAKAREHIGPSRHIECRDHLDRAVDCILRYLEERHEGQIAESVRSPISNALDLDALQALCDRATPGPWVSETGTAVWVELEERTPAGRPRWGAICEIDGGNDAPMRDAAFIAAARDALPKLIAEVRRLREVACTCDGCTGRRANNA